MEAVMPMEAGLNRSRKRKTILACSSSDNNEPMDQKDKMSAEPKSPLSRPSIQTTLTPSKSGGKSAPVLQLDRSPPAVPQAPQKASRKRARTTAPQKLQQSLLEHLDKASSAPSTISFDGITISIRQIGETQPDITFEPSVSRPECAAIYADGQEDELRSQIDHVEQHVWDYMLELEPSFMPAVNFLEHHPQISERNRYILLDWLLEVSEELNLHRETSHLAVNLLDRYLSATKDFPKEYFQLLGVSSLFIAAKVEEIYSPKVQEFSDVTDGACLVEAIHKMELKLLPTLSWRLAAPTAQSFAGLFLQNAARLTREDPSEGTIHAGSQLDCPMSRLKYFVGPRYETEIFMEVMNLIDTAIHRAEVYRFLNSTLAAAAVFTVVQARGGNTPAFVHNLEMACGRKMHEISDCIAWISAFRDYPLQIAEQIPRFVPSIDPGDIHNIQRHNFALLRHLALVDRSNAYRAQGKSKGPEEKCLPNV